MDTVQTIPEVQPSANKKKNGKLFLIIGIAAVVVIAAVIAGILILSGDSKSDRYDAAIAALEEDQIDDAVDIYKEIGDYKDLGEKIQDAALDATKDHLRRKDYVRFVRVTGYVKDYEEIFGEIQKQLEDEVEDLMKSHNYDAAIELYARLKKYESLQAVVETQYAAGVEKVLEEGQYYTASEMFYMLSNQELQMDAVNEAIYNGAVKASEKEDFTAALDLLDLIGDYKDSAQLREEIRVSTYMKDLKYYLEIGNYSWAEYLIENYDGDKQPLIDEYIKYCGDSTVLADLEQALMNRLDEEAKEGNSYMALINAEWELLSKYEYMPFYDDYLYDLFIEYFYALENQKYYAEYFEGYNYYDFYERTYYWAICDAERFEALTDLYDEYKFAKDNQKLKSVFLDRAEFVRAYAEAGYHLSADIDHAIYWGDVYEGDGGIQYIIYKNETEYTFDLTIYHYDETGMIVEEDTVSYTGILPEQEVMIPVGVTGEFYYTDWWELGWSIAEITGGDLAE